MDDDEVRAEAEQDRLEEWQARVAAWEIELDRREAYLIEMLSTILTDARLREVPAHLDPAEYRRFFYANITYRLGECLQLSGLLCGAGRLVPAPPAEETPANREEEDAEAAGIYIASLDGVELAQSKKVISTAIPWSDKVQ